MDNNVKERYMLCRKCCKNHVTSADDYMLKSIVSEAIVEINRLLKNNGIVGWKNIPENISSGTGFIDGFSGDDTKICYGCKYKLEHVVIGENNERI